MTEKWIINDDGEVEDTTTHMTFDSFWELLTVLNGQSRHLNQLSEENEQLKSFKNDVHDLIDELIKKAEKDVEDLRKDAYEKGYDYNPYYYWGVAHGLEKLKKELKE